MGVFFVIIIAIVIIVAINRTPGKNKLQNTENIKPGSKVVGVNPYVKGSKQYKHYEVTVKFADGSSYTTDLGERGFMTIRYNQQHLNNAIQEAVTAHEEEALKKAGQSAEEQSSPSTLVANENSGNDAVLDKKEVKTDLSTRSAPSVSMKHGDDGKADIGGQTIGSHVNREEATAYFIRVQSFFNDILSEIKDDGTIIIVSDDSALDREKSVSGDRLLEAAHLLSYDFMKPTPSNVNASVMIEAFSHMMNQTDNCKAEEIKKRLLKVNSLLLMRASLHQGEVASFADWMAFYSLFEKEKNKAYYVVVDACEKAIRKHIPEIESMSPSHGNQAPVLDKPQKVGSPVEKVIHEKESVISDNPAIELEKGEETIDNGDICYCRKCGFKLLPDSTFCSRCGARID